MMIRLTKLEAGFLFFMGLCIGFCIGVEITRRFL